MNKTFLVTLSTLILGSASLALVGCIGEPGVGIGVGVSGPAYYDDGPYLYGNPYYHEHNDFFMQGGGGYRGGWDHGGERHRGEWSHREHDRD
jgi:hypothetical protein